MFCLKNWSSPDTFHNDKLAVIENIASDGRESRLKVLNISVASLYFLQCDVEGFEVLLGLSFSCSPRQCSLELAPGSPASDAWPRCLYRLLHT